MTTSPASPSIAVATNFVMLTLTCEFILFANIFFSFTLFCPPFCRVILEGSYYQTLLILNRCRQTDVPVLKHNKLNRENTCQQCREEVFNILFVIHNARRTKFTATSVPLFITKTSRVRRHACSNYFRTVVAIIPAQVL